MRIKCYDIIWGDIMNIGSKLKELRKDAKVTQKVIADNLGIKVNTYSQYENDLRQPPYAFLEKIVEYFNTDYNFIFSSGRDSNDYLDQLDRFFDKYVNLKRKIYKYNRGLAVALDNNDKEISDEIKFRLKQMYDKLYKYNQTIIAIQFNIDRDVYSLEAEKNFSRSEYEQSLEKMNEDIDFSRVFWDNNY